MTFETVQIGRGLAAIMIVFAHASTSFFPSPHYWHVTVFSRFFNFGLSGVDFFFVLSGFIVAHVHAGEIGRPDRFCRYVRRRFLRIYPIYWVVLVGTVALSFSPLHVADSVRSSVRTIVTSAMLIGDSNRPTVMVVAWSLFHEMLFYIVFGIWLISVRAGALITAVWLALIGVGLTGIAIVPDYAASPLNLQFVLGIAAWWLSRHCRLPAPVAMTVCGGVMFVALGVEWDYFPIFDPILRHLLFGVASAIGITGIVTRERRAPITVGRFPLMLGAASYALYLTHYALLSLVAKLVFRLDLGQLVPADVAYPLVIALVIGGAVAFHVFVELPVIGGAKRLLARPRGAAPQNVRSSGR